MFYIRVKKSELIGHLLVVDFEVRGLEFARVAGADAVEERAAQARDEAGAGAEPDTAARTGRRGLVRIAAAAHSGAHHRVRLARACSVRATGGQETN